MLKNVEEIEEDTEQWIVDQVRLNSKLIGSTIGVWLVCLLCMFISWYDDRISPSWAVFLSTSLTTHTLAGLTARRNNRRLQAVVDQMIVHTMRRR